MSLHKLLQNELNKIIEESRKDFHNVKESSERMLLLLKSIQYKDETFAQAIKKSGEVVKPFLLCCETKNPKLIAHGLSSFQLLVSHDALPDEGAIGIIIETLLRIYDQQDEVISLKIIQLSLLILTHSKYNLDVSIYSKTFNLYFILNAHKNIIINQTSFISLRQSIPIFFEKKGVESIDFFEDLFLFLDNKPTIWVNIQNVTKSFVLEMIEEIVRTFHTLLKSKDEFKKIIIEKILPLIHEKIQKSEEFSECLKYNQMALSLLESYFDILDEKQLEDLLSLIAHESTSNSWKKVLGLEIIRNLFQNEYFLKKINVEKKQNNFDILINPLRDSIQKFDQLDFKYKQNSYKRLQANHEFQPNHEEVLNLCIDAINNLTKSISNIIGLEEKEYLKTDLVLLELTWSGVLSTLIELLEKSQHDDTIDIVLQSYLLFTTLSGLTHLSTPRDAFLTSLCKYTVPKGGENNVNKNIKVLKVLFHITRIIGPYLGTSWYLILKNFQMLNSFLMKNGFSKDLGDLFKDTKNFKIDSLLNLIKQLIKLSMDSSNLFADEKLMEIIFIHIKRLGEIFDLISPHLIYLCKTKNIETEKFTIENYCNLIITKCELGLSEELELKLFKTLREIYEIEGSIKKLSLQSLSIIIQKCGQNLNNNAWNEVLKILQNGSKLDDFDNITLAFKCTQYIGNDFLPLLNLSEYIKTVGCYSQQEKTDDINTNLVAIGLFMTLSDYFQNLENINEMWITLYLELIESTTDLRYEVRNSAIKTLTFALTSHGKKLNDEGWNLCLNQILTAVLDKIQISASSIKEDDESGLVSLKSVKKSYVHHSRDNITKQWSETRKLSIEGISRILIENSNSIFHLNSFVDFSNEFIRFLINSIKTKSEEIFHVISNVLFDLILKSTGKPKEILFDNSWEIWNFISKHVQQQSTILLILTGFDQLFEQDLLKEKEVKLILEICSKLMMSPIALKGISSPSKIQETILDLYKKLSTKESKLVFQSLVSFLPLNEFKTLQGHLLPKKFPNVELYITIQNIIVEEFDFFDSIIRILGECMMTRYIIGDFPLWKQTIKSFKKIILNHMINVKLTYENWNELCSQIENFIFTKDTNDGLFDEEEVIMSNLIFEMITKMESNDDINIRLISILRKSTELSPKPIASESLSYLFQLIKFDQISHLVLPEIENLCIEIFENFIKEDKRSGGLPMPRYRRQEVLNVFKELKKVEIDPSLFKDTSDIKFKGKKGLIVKLFPYLCEFIACTEDNSFKMILLDLFRIASEELGLNKLVK
eukprot:gene3423-5968_t